MKRYLYLFPLMALTAATFTLSACDDKKSEDAAATEQTAPADTAAADSVVAPAPATINAEGAYAFATAESTTGAVFVTLFNPGTAPDKLVGATTEAASSVEIHETSTDANGIMQMRKVDAVEVPAGQQVDLTPQSGHLMLMGLKSPLAVGTEFQITLDFETAPDVTVPVSVRAPGATTETPAATTPAPTTSAEPTPDEPMPTEGTTDTGAPATEGAAPAVESPAPDAAAPATTEAPAAPASDAAPAGDAHSGH